MRDFCKSLFLRHQVSMEDGWPLVCIGLFEGCLPQALERFRSRPSIKAKGQYHLKVTPTVLLLLFVATAQAQNLPSKPVSPGMNDPLSPVWLGPPARRHVDSNTFIPDGMVWWKHGGYWYARDEDSCNYCGKPLTFRQAALDRKAIFMMGLQAGLQVGDILAIRRCDNRGYCREGAAPFLGDGSVKKQMALKMPIVAFTWMSMAYIRKGDKSRHIGGSKSWWHLPVLFDVISTGAMVANLKQQHSF